MRSIIKKQITILLVAVIFLAAIPLNAFADGGDVTEGTEPAGQEQELEVTAGWNEDGTAYTDEDGNVLTDCVADIEGVLYYFNENGVVDTFSGWKTIGEDTYWADEAGTIANSATIFTVNGTRKRSTRILYYNTRTHKWQKKRIKNARMKPKTITEPKVYKYLYLFDIDGKLITTKGLFKHNGHYYYGVGNGRVKPAGWRSAIKPCTSIQKRASEPQTPKSGI